MRRFLLALSLSLLGFSGAAVAQTYSIPPCNSVSECESMNESSSFAYSREWSKVNDLSSPTDSQLQAAIVSARDAAVVNNLYSQALNSYYQFENDGIPLSESGYPEFTAEYASNTYSEGLSHSLTQAAYYQHRYYEGIDQETFDAAVYAMSAQVAEQTYSENYQAANTPPSGGGETPPVEGGGGTTTPPAGEYNPSDLEVIVELIKIHKTEVLLGIFAIASVLAVILAAVLGARKVLGMTKGGSDEAYERKLREGRDAQLKGGRSSGTRRRKAA